MARSAAVAQRAQRELDIARFETKELSGVVATLHRRLDRLEARRSAPSDVPPLELGSSDDDWGPVPGPGRSAPLAEPVGATARPPRVAAVGSVMSG